MKISTKGTYAIEAMVDLAMHTKNNVESIKYIAERRELSDKYLEQIVGALRKAGLVTSIRGAGGGYQLSRAANKIKVLEILQAVESNLVPMECLHKEADCGVKHASCVSRKLWDDIWNEIKEVTESITLNDLVEESEKYVMEENIEYFI